MHGSFLTGGEKVKQIIFETVQFCVRNEGGGKNVKNPTEHFWDQPAHIKT